jgi:hypothetical protein
VPKRRGAFACSVVDRFNLGGPIIFRPSRTFSYVGAASRFLLYIAILHDELQIAFFKDQLDVLNRVAFPDQYVCPSTFLNHAQLRFDDRLVESDGADLEYAALIKVIDTSRN